MSKSKATKKILEGIALGDSVNKTVVVSINSIKIGRIYKKRYVTAKKYIVHTDIEVKKGEKVKITETRPISKKKSWKVSQQ